MTEELATLSNLLEGETDFHAKVDAVESFLRTIPGNNTGEPPDHTLTPGLYSRRLFMPAGSIIVSKIHRKEHQYVVLAGRVLVYTEDGAERIQAPYCGVTKAGTRRILMVEEDTLWITFHPTDETELDAIEADLILPRHELGVSPSNHLPS